MALHDIKFDVTDANTRAETHSVGAVLYDAVNDRLGLINASQELLVKDTDAETAINTVNTTLGNGIDVNLQDGSGNDISSTAGALDVNIASGTLSVSLDSEFDEDSAHTSGDKGQHILAVRQDTLAASTSADGDYASLKSNASGELYVTANISNASLQVTQGTSPWVIGDGGGSITVDATALDIRPLTAATDSVDAWTHDGSGNAIGSTAGSLDVNVTNAIDVDDGIADTALLAKAETVGTSAGQIVDGGDELANRKYLFMYNNSSRRMYIGASGVDTTDGFPIPPRSILETRIGPSVDVYAIGAAAGLNMRTLQLS